MCHPDFSTWNGSHLAPSGSKYGSERVNPNIPNPLTPSKNATGIKPTAFSVSGDEENRTLDLLHAMQALYQLSYVPKMSRLSPKT